MKLKKYLFILISLLYLDLVFNLFAYDVYLKESIINIFLFDVINAGIITIITSLFSDKVNKIITYIIYLVLWFWYSLYYVFYRVFITPFSIALFRQTDQILKFGKSVIISILQNIHVILLFLLPLVIVIIFRKKIKHDKKIKSILIYLGITILGICLYLVNIHVSEKKIGSI
ncbi:MAG: hypothetical protein IKI04_01120, partial [Bacilli bacterium]|nr:hypothetical protein [Bacilli bacterium]